MACYGTGRYLVAAALLMLMLTSNCLESVRATTTADNEPVTADLMVCRPTIADAELEFYELYF